MSALDLDPWLPPYPPLVDRLWPDGKVSAGARVLALVGAGCALLVLAGRLGVPFWPVPLSGFPFAVSLIGAVYGARLGGLSVGLFLMLGVAGLPVFAASPERGVGLAYLMGPEGGYLIGALPAVLVIGLAVRQGWDRRARGALTAVASGLGVLVLCGAGWLAWLAGIEEAWRGNLLPFLPIYLVQGGLAWACVSLIWRLLRMRSIHF